MTVVVAAQLTALDVRLLAVVVVLILLAAVTTAAETALARISRARAESLNRDGQRAAAALNRLVDGPERALNALPLTALSAKIVQAVLTGVVANRLFGGGGIAVATVVNVIVVFVVADAAPKTWALQNHERVALALARPMAALVAFPPVRVLTSALIGATNVLLPGKGMKTGPWVSEEDLLAVAAEAAAAQSIEADEQALIESIIEFGDTVVREVMVPRPDVVAVSHDFRAVDVMEVVLLNGFSRIPVMGESIDDIVGLVFAKDLMRAERDGREHESVANFVRPARVVPESKAVAELLRQMQSEQFHMAIVVDEYGGTAGVVTIEDLIEELVGEIVDEFDTEDARVEPLADGGLRVSGSLSIDDANDLLDLDLPEGEFDTVSGLLLAELGRMAAVGDSCECAGARLTVERVQGRRIVRVRIERLDPEPDSESSPDDGASAASDSSPDPADNSKGSAERPTGRQSDDGGASSEISGRQVSR